MRNLALVLGFASITLAAPQSLSEPRKITGLYALSLTAAGRYGYVASNGMVYRLQRSDDMVRKVDSIGYEGNSSEQPLYIARGESTGFLVFRDSVCSVNWGWIKEDRMMCTGGVSLGWGGYTGGITMGKLSVCGGTRAYTIDMSNPIPQLIDSVTGSDRKVCEVKNSDQIELRRTSDVATFYRCLSVTQCVVGSFTSITPGSVYDLGRFRSNGSNSLVLDSLGRLGSWYAPAGASVTPIPEYLPTAYRETFLAGGGAGSNGRVAIGFDSTLVFGRRVDLGLDEVSTYKLGGRIGWIDLKDGALWVQVGRDVLSFEVKESTSALAGPASHSSLSMVRSGRGLEFRPVEGVGKIRILRLDGSLEAAVQLGASPVRWVAPGPGLRLIEGGGLVRAVMIP